VRGEQLLREGARRVGPITSPPSIGPGPL